MTGDSTDSIAGKKDKIEDPEKNYAPLFSDKCEFRKLCEYLGILSTEHECEEINGGTDDGGVADAIRKSGIRMPVLVQERRSPENGKNHAVVVGDTSNTAFLKEIDGIYSGTEVILSHFRDPYIPVSVSATVSELDILIASECVDLHIRDRPDSNFILKYHGCDLDAFEDCRKSHPFFSDIAKDLERSATRICKALQLRGFTGNLSIDAIIIGTEVRFVSINDCNAKPSLAYTAVDAMLNATKNKGGAVDKAKTDTDKKLLTGMKMELEATGSAVSVILYEMNSCESAAPGEKRFNEYIQRISSFPIERRDCVERAVTELYRGENNRCIAFRDNIVSINIGKVVFNPNLLPMSQNWEIIIFGNRVRLALKLDLINRGIRAGKEVYGKPVIYKLDFGNGLLSVKVSAEERIASLSPYTISDGTLRYFDKDVAKVISVEKIGDSVDKYTTKGVRISEICEVEDGTLRVRHCSGCRYARDNVGCRYCKYTKTDFKMCDFDQDDIGDAVRKIKELRDEGKVSFDRAVIGGGCISTPHKTVLESIINTAKSINDTFGNTAEEIKLPIILACPPPSIQTDMDLFKKNGIHGIVISVEVFDPPKSKECLPGKDRVPLSAFYYTLRHAVSLWGWKNVYSNLIPGLEDPNMTREGCGQIASTGARPVISPFRPIAGTELQDVMPLPAETLYKLCNNVLEDYYSFHPDMDPFDETDGIGPFDTTRDPEIVVMPIKKWESGKSQGADE